MKIMHSQRGFSLVEITLALGVMAFCLLALFGLLPVGLQSNQNAVEQTTAGNIAAAIAADLQATPLTEKESLRFRFNMASAGGSPQTLFFAEDSNPTGSIGSAASTGIPASRFRASVAFLPSTGKQATPVRILVTWPALADKTATGWPKNFSGSFETVIALNRK